MDATVKCGFEQGFVHVMIIPQKKVSCLKPQTTVYMQDLCVSPNKRND